VGARGGNRPSAAEAPEEDFFSVGGSSGVTEIEGVTAAGAERRAGLKARPYEKIRKYYLRQSEQTPPISVRITVISIPVSLAIWRFRFS
jgi:hypothetical protein